MRRSTEYGDVLHGIKVPKTWYLTSDAILSFIEHNQLDDVHNHKYLELEQIRREYPHLVQVFKHSQFPPELAQGVGLALDDFGDVPLIVRSSSLLEDRTGAAFSGKYKSLFLANQGARPERLGALMDAIAEVYASVFGPDPIEYRANRGLLDFHEEMGIMIQEVVGTRVGPYYLPAFAGVAFSHNEFRWSPRIRRRTAWSASCRGSARARWTGSATITRCSSRPASRACAPTSRRRKSSATRPARST